jgi:L-ascorbate metabolism protein UlaG (beta-lactamase superfamily)
MESSLRREGLLQALDRSRTEELDELNRGHRPDRHLSLLGAWAAGWLRRRTRVEADPLPPLEPGEVGVTFGGHTTLLLRWPRLAVVMNPMLGGRVGLAPRAVQPGLTIDDLSMCDLILITQPGPEYLHRPTLARLPRGASVVVPPRCAGLVSGLGFARVVELGTGSSFALRGVEVVSTAVRHHGPACAYVLRGEGPALFACAASGYFSGFAEIGARHRPDIAILPIGGYAPPSFRREHLSPADALYALDDLRARMLIPIRHGTFALSYERLEEPIRWLRRLVADRDLGPFVSELRPGESRKFVDPS